MNHWIPATATVRDQTGHILGTYPCEPIKNDAGELVGWQTPFETTVPAGGSITFPPTNHQRLNSACRPPHVE